MTQAIINGDLSVTNNVEVGPFTLGLLPPSLQGRISATGSGAEFSFARRNLTSWPAQAVAGDRFVWYSPDGTARLWTEGNFDLLTVTATGDLTVKGSVNANGILLTSSRELKENIAELSGKEAVEALKNLNPVKFNFKADSDKNPHIGFIAEDVPELVATSDRKTLSPMDIVAVLTQALKEQQNTISALVEKVKLLEVKTA
jgi:hypothetical protein